MSAHSGEGGVLNQATCARLLSDSTHLFRHMWGVKPWKVSQCDDDTKCWSVSREAPFARQPASSYESQTLLRSHCASTNWLEGTPNQHGQRERGVLAHRSYVSNFSRPAPAVVGTDLDIETACHGASFVRNWSRFAPCRNTKCANHRSVVLHRHATSCVASGYNLLFLHGRRLPYNLCRNLEWLVCAATGSLPLQLGAPIRIASPTHNLSTALIGSRYGGLPKGQDVFKYTSDDVFWLELCLLSQLCVNGGELFAPTRGQQWRCEFSIRGFRDLLATLRAPVAPYANAKCRPRTPAPAPIVGHRQRAVWGAPPGRLPLRHIFWLHVPKTGSEFSFTIYAYACGPSSFSVSRDDWPAMVDGDCGGNRSSLQASLPPHRGVSGPAREKYWFHRPPPWASPDVGSVVMMMRRPNQRILSSVTMLTSESEKRRCCGLEWGWHQRARLAAFQLARDCCRAHNGSLHVIALQPFSALLRLEGFTSCQAKLLLGHGCLAPVTLRESDILRAEEILR